MTDVTKTDKTPVRPARSPKPRMTEAKALLRLAVPLALAEISFVVMTTTDMALMGFIGVDELAAGALTINATWLVMFIAFGIIMACGPLIAQALGAKDPQGLRRSARQGFWVAMTLTPFVMGGIWLTPDALLLMDQPAHLVELGRPFAQVLAFSLPPSLGGAVIWDLFSAHQRPKVPMLITMVAMGINAGLDWVLMFGLGTWPGLGLVGAAWSTVAVNWFIFLVLLAMALRDPQFHQYRLFQRFWRPDWQRYRDIFRVGFPLGLAMLVEMGFFSICTFLVGLFEPEVLGAHALALQITGLVYMIGFGLSQASTMRVGHAAGARLAEGVRLSGGTALRLAFGTTILFCLALMFSGETLMGLFAEGTDGERQRFIEVGAGLLFIAAFVLTFDAARAVLHGNLAGLTDTRIPMLAQALGFWVFGLGTSVSLCVFFDMGARGVWIGMVVGTMAAFTLLLLRWHSQVKKARGWQPL